MSPYRFPHQAFADLVVALDWKSCVVLYEESEGLVRLQEVLKLHPKKREIEVQLRQLEPGPGNDYRSGSFWSYSIPT